MQKEADKRAVDVTDLYLQLTCTPHGQPLWYIRESESEEPVQIGREVNNPPPDRILDYDEVENIDLNDPKTWSKDSDWNRR
ncbi:MAG: hypothetical protein ACFFD4_22685 [Candidatus Odinarchaeota archaeon]